MENTKKQYLKIAHDLCYSSEVIKAIEDAKTHVEIENILHDARLGIFRRGEENGKT